MGYNLEWKHGNDYLNIPVSVEKTVSSGYGYSGQLICNSKITDEKGVHECHGDLKQQYVCLNCDNKLTLGEISKRKDKETKIIYEEYQKKAYLKSKIGRTIKIQQEIPLSDFWQYAEYCKGFYEIFENGKYAEVIRQIHVYLTKKNVALITKYGRLDKECAGLIIPAHKKLIMIELVDHRLVKPNAQQNIATEGNADIKNALRKYTKSNLPELIEEFLDKIADGKEIEIEEEEKPQEIVECDFLKV